MDWKVGFLVYVKKTQIIDLAVNNLFIITDNSNLAYYSNIKNQTVIP